MMEEFESQKVVSIGGLNSNVNHIQLSDLEPGSAVSLINFEASLYGGYRRLSGYSPFIQSAPVVDPDNAEGKILCVAIYKDNVITARKQIGSNTYEFYANTGSDWTKLTTGLTRNSLNVNRIRWDTYNFNGTEKIIFVDGINPAVIYDGTDWSEIIVSNSGADVSNAGGDQALETPSYVEVFKNHIFIAQDHIVAHSAPLEDYNWTAASGAGQLPVGFDVNQIKMFRDNNYVFGINNIKAISVSGSNFVVNEVASNIGCLASDSVIEIGGNLVFLSQDGFRPISGTERISDIELESLSRKIQQLVVDRVNDNDMRELCAVLVRGKSQVRFFFSNPNINKQDNYGIIGCIREQNTGGAGWEWGQIKGFRANCAASAYISSTARELILHGDYDGRVYQQEVGNSFDGMPVEAVYTTPYLDFGDAGLRKTMRKIKLFVRPEGSMTVGTRLTYDWMDPEKLNPDPYSIGSGVSDSISVYGTAIYDHSTYSSLNVPVLISNVQGSGFSVQMSYFTSDTKPPYTIQGALYEFNVEGRK